MIKAPHSYMRIKVQRIVLLTLCLGLSAQSCYAGLFDNVKKHLELIIDEHRQSKEQAPPEIKPLLKATLPSDLPADWSLQAFTDPVFGSEIVVAETGNPKGPTLLLVHGLGQAGMRDWLSVVPALQRDYRVLLLDLPGFGSSAKPQGRYSPSNYARVLSKIKQHYSPTQQILAVGHSMGGAVTLRYASMFPQELKKIVLIDAAGILERGAFMKHSAKIPLDESIGPNRYKGFIAGLKDKSNNFIELINALPDPTKYIYSDKIWGKVFANKTNVNAAIALIEEDFSSAIYTLNMSSAIIWGSKDRIAPIRTGKVLAKHLPQTSFDIIYGAGHMPMKSHTNEFNNLLLKALNTNKGYKPTPVKNYSLVSTENTLSCNNEAGKTYNGGHYKEVSIKECTAITLKNITSEKITITNSEVTADTVSIDSNLTALTVNKSVLLGTNVFIKGETAISLDESRLDIAGGQIIASKNAVYSGGKSHLIFSVSQMESPIYDGSIHGNFRLEKTTLDSKLE